MHIKKIKHYVHLFNSVKQDFRYSIKLRLFDDRVIFT